MTGRDVGRFALWNLLALAAAVWLTNLATLLVADHYSASWWACYILPYSLFVLCNDRLVHRLFPSVRRAQP